MQLRDFALCSVLLGIVGCTGGDDTKEPVPSGAEAGLPLPPRACNGHPELCTRRYDEVAFPATHNANSAREYGYPVNANQVSGFAKQMADGVRAFLMDVYPGETANVFCHGVCSLASTSHLDGLGEFKEFLEGHPNEVFTFIYEDHVEPAALAADLEASGLSDLAYTHDPSAPWPTLGEMIHAGTRLVVTAESAGPPPPWLHHVWDVAFDTPYTFLEEADFTCDLNRGEATNALFLMNHWLSVSPPLNLPTEEGAKVVNRREVLLPRAERCRAETGRIPNFVAVDFYESGDLFAVVDTLNGLD